MMLPSTPTQEITKICICHWTTRISTQERRKNDIALKMILGNSNRLRGNVKNDPAHPSPWIIMDNPWVSID
jgi:hypothetical protein